MTGMNIAFIGLPGCGKTTVSRLAAEALGMVWFDSDIEIERSEGMSISDIFAQRGEEYFRGLETRRIESLIARENAVIALGGGAVERNGELIRRSSAVVYLRRSVESILATLEPGTRPLLSDSSKLHAIFERRGGLYERLSDITIDNEGVIEDTVKKVLEALR